MAACLGYRQNIFARIISKIWYSTITFYYSFINYKQNRDSKALYLTINIDEFKLPSNNIDSPEEPYVINISL